MFIGNTDRTARRGWWPACCQSSTETTFYTIAVYYGSVRIRKTRHTLAAAVTGDVFGIVLSALAVRMLLLKA